MMNSNMQSFPDRIREELYNAVEYARKEQTDYQEQNILFGHNPVDFSRSRILDFNTIVNFLIYMQGGSLQKELYKAGIKVSASAFVQRRKQLSWWDFEKVFETFVLEKEEIRRYKGYRVLAVDGTALNISRNPKSASFMQNSNAPKGYNQLHINPLYDILNKVYLSCLIQPQPQMDEIGALAYMIAWYSFDEKTIIVADRGYESYNTFAHFMEIGTNAKFLIRVKQNRSAMREIAKLPMKELDTTVSFTITTTQTKADKENNYIYVQKRKNADRVYSDKTKNARWDYPSPYQMSFRVVRFMLKSGEYETLATNLPQDFTLEEIKELYHSRWGIETSFRTLKYSVGMLHTHGKSDEFAMQEVFASMIMHNFASRIAGQVILQNKENNIHEYAVNMKMCIFLCQEFLRTGNGSGEQLMQDIMRYTEAVRPERENIRNITPTSFVPFVYRV